MISRAFSTFSRKVALKIVSYNAISLFFSTVKNIGVMEDDRAFTPSVSNITYSGGQGSVLHGLGMSGFGFDFWQRASATIVLSSFRLHFTILV